VLFVGSFLALLETRIISFLTKRSSEAFLALAAAFPGCEAEESTDLLINIPILN